MKTSPNNTLVGRTIITDDGREGEIVAYNPKAESDRVLAILFSDGTLSNCDPNWPRHNYIRVTSAQPNQNETVEKLLKKILKLLEDRQARENQALAISEAIRIGRDMICCLSEPKPGDPNILGEVGTAGFICSTCYGKILERGLCLEEFGFGEDDATIYRDNVIAWKGKCILCDREVKVDNRAEVEAEPIPMRLNQNL